MQPLFDWSMINHLLIEDEVIIEGSGYSLNFEDLFKFRENWTTCLCSFICFPFASIWM
jgi:hypothetical protein